MWWYVCLYSAAQEESLIVPTGEGALIALKGSPLGLATDMGMPKVTFF